MNLRSTYKFYLVLLIVLTILIRIPFLKSMNLGVAPIENFNIAQHLAREGHFVTSIKSNFFYDTPIVHSAVGEVNIPFPVLVSLLIRIGVDYLGIQILNSFLATVIVLLSFLMFSRFFGAVVGFWSSLLISFNLYFMRMSIIAADDIFFILTVVVTIFLFLYLKQTILLTILLGMCSGISYLTRNVGIFLFLSFLIYHFFFTKDYKKASILFIAFLFTIAPILWLIYKEQGSLLDWTTLNFMRRYDNDRGLWQGLYLQLPSFNEFLKANSLQIIKRNLELFYLYIKALVGPSFLSFLSIFLLLVKKKNFQSEKLVLLLIYAILNLFVFSTFLNGSDEKRFLLPSFIFFTPFALFCLKNLDISLVKTKLSYKALNISFFSAVTFLVVFIYIIKVAVSWAELKKENYFDPKIYHSACEWAKKNTPEETHYAATIPWVFNLLADRPTIILPNIQSDKGLRDFTKKYDVSYVVVDTGFKPYGPHPRYGELFMRYAYDIISVSSPDLLEPVFKHSYLTGNEKFLLFIFKVNHR